MNVTLLSLPGTKHPTNKAEALHRLCWDMVCWTLVARSEPKAIASPNRHASHSQQAPLWPHLLSELVGLRPSKPTHSCILGAFLPPPGVGRKPVK